MISTTQLGLFAVASVWLVLLPGPAVAYILSVTLRHGRGVGVASAVGIDLAYLVHVAGTVLGVSAVIAASAEAFTAVKLAGAAYLAVLAVLAWRRRATGTLADLAATPDVPPSLGRAFLRAVPIGVLNPKTAIFYLAFLPQFVRDGAGPVPLQLAVFGVLFIAVALVLDTMWALAGGQLRRLAPRLRIRTVDRFSGTVMAALATVTLTARRTVT